MRKLSILLVLAAFSLGACRKPKAEEAPAVQSTDTITADTLGQDTLKIGD